LLDKAWFFEPFSAAVMTATLCLIISMKARGGGELA
jgi:hypothetical protein